jgi:2-dehydro-3-deoxyphosphogluconate aldolase/(4S)-4-hydroxy-2-oxoglutarate aldolase
VVIGLGEGLGEEQGPVARREFLGLLRARRLVAIIRGSDPEASVRTAAVLVEEGIDLLEVSLSGSDAVAVIERIRAELGPDVVLGAGTVLAAAQAEAVAAAGASFAVTPAMSEGAARAIELGLPTLIGAWTPTEVWQAFSAGAAAVKVFPASSGGAAHVKALRDPFPGVPLVPVGGVGAEEAVGHLEAGAVAVGVGSPLAGDAPHGGDLAALRLRSRRFRAAVAPWTVTP